jgi:hypothetical protein
MEYDVVPISRRVPEEQAAGEASEVSGYIILVGGIQRLSVGGGSPVSQGWFSAPAVYSAPSFAIVSLGVNPDG